MASFRKKTRVLDGKVSLGVSDILTVTVDGQSAPNGMTIDIRGGTVEWNDQNNLGFPGPYLFEGTHRTPEETEDNESSAGEKRKNEIRKTFTVDDFMAAYLEEQAGDSSDMVAIKAEWARIKAAE